MRLSKTSCQRNVSLIIAKNSWLVQQLEKFYHLSFSHRFLTYSLRNLFLSRNLVVCGCKRTGSRSLPCATGDESVPISIPHRRG